MSSLAPPWALFAEAIDGIDDTHLPKGIHVRALPSPRAGLPATPLFVYRAVLAAELVARLAQHTEITWIDSFGNVLVPPFSVTPDKPVLGYLPSAQCVWIELLGESAGDPDRGEGLVFEAMAQSQDGPAPFAARTRPPYVLASQRIDLVRVGGLGRVSGVRWLAREDLLKNLRLELWRLWSLPVREAPRYTPTAGAVGEAKDRVLRGAPTRQPMYVAYTAPYPGSAPGAAPIDAMDRVDATRDVVERWLDAVLNDLSLPTWEIKDTYPISEADGEISVPVEGHLLAGAIDPDGGRWLGFGDNDNGLKATPGDLVVYHVRGLWRWFSTRWRAIQLGALADFVRPDLQAALAAFPEVEQHGVEPRLDGAYLDLGVLAPAIVGYPPVLPGAPSIDGFDDRGWLAEPPPPDVRRIVRVRGSGFRPRALVALVATDHRGERTLNPIARIGRLPPGEPHTEGTPLPLVVTRPFDAVGPGQGRFDDRDAPEDEVTYRMAQGDWFGRWSDWASDTAPPKARAMPLPPAVELYYAPPDIAPGPVPTGSLSGTLTIRVPVPRVPELPAGGHLLHRLVVDLTIDAGAPASTQYVLDSLVGATLEPHPSPGHDMLVIEQVGPPIPRSGKRSATVVARWIDQGNLISTDSPPAKRQLVDPRPPPLPPVNTELQYSARPDATGYARVELSWTSVPGTRYRVFASTEPTLIKALQNAGKTAIVDEILDADPGAPRAGVLRDNKQHFDWDAFECVTEVPLVATGATTRFVHRVSGSLERLAVYRVLSEGESGVLAEMTEADVIPVAVPNLGPPAQPLVSIEREPEDHQHEGVRLRVKVLAGRAVPVAWRLRRASVPASDPLRMSVVLTGAVPGGSTTAAGTELVIEDPTPLKAWRQYRWSVEVQAGPPPGAPTIGPVPAGEWSPASAPVTLAVIPADAPVAPASVVASAVAGGVELVISHPHAGELIGTALGSYRFEIYRASPGQRPVQVTLPVTRATGNTFEAVETTPPASSQWSVRVVDPIGRVSEAIVSNQV
jgi:hypothetical protein